MPSPVEYVLFDMDGEFSSTYSHHFIQLFSCQCTGLMIDSEKIYTDVTSN